MTRSPSVAIHAGTVARTRQFVGCDVVTVSDVEASIRDFGERYLDRVYTRLERTQTNDRPERVAARFAGKEAVMKVLRPGRSDAIPYSDIEIRVAPSGAPRVRLLGAARARADQNSLDGFAVSLSHDGGVAFATVVAHSIRRNIIVMIDTIRDALEQFGRLTVPVATLGDDDDLYKAGLTSHATVNVMLAIEDELDIEFPDDLLSRSTFATVASMSAAMSTLVVAS